MRQVKTGSAELLRETRRILRKFRKRIAPEPVAAIEQASTRLAGFRSDRNWDGARIELERLDELLHQHASFARKGILRELTENVSLAILFALSLRSCFYEPFKIPSGSMMPTLRSGDHIFVNKFTYGIQIPFTTTIVGEWVGDIEHGDVVVFRYPINEEEDFIKRVMGLPGDTIRVDGEKVSVRRAGQDEFEVLPRTRLEEPCRDETGEQVIGRCALFEETYGDKTYTVRYTTPVDPRTGGITRRRGEWTVPERHLLVMGDNRNQSHDSLAWTKTVEAISAEGLLAPKDMRDLTAEKMFRLAHPDDRSLREQANYDHLTYTAEHRSQKHLLQLDLWRQPTLGRDVVFATATDKIPESQDITFDQLIQDDAFLATHEAERKAVTDAGAAVEKMVGTIEREGGYSVVVGLGEADSVLAFRCGRAACQTDGAFAQKLAGIITAFAQNPKEDARKLLKGGKGAKYQQNWTSRGLERDKFLDRTFTTTGKSEESADKTVRLRAWRDSQEPESFVHNAAMMRAVATTIAVDRTSQDGDDAQAKILEPQAVDSLGEEARVVEGKQTITVVNRLGSNGLVYMLECGKQRCQSV
ncbi:MAG: signal peptidase I, partial [Nannocystaceae bacterium]